MRMQNAQDVFVLVKSSQVWGEPMAISVLSSTFFEWGMLVWLMTTNSIHSFVSYTWVLIQYHIDVLHIPIPKIPCI